MILSSIFAVCLFAAAEVNTALVPVPKLENDSYDWYARHERIVREAKAMDPEILFIGDSITHFWAGRNSIGGADALPRWKKAFGSYRTLNIGFGWDRIQNVLWRIENGEIKDLKPRVIVLLIGTNNTSETPNARENTAEEITKGIETILAKIHRRFPKAKIVVMNVFPRGTNAKSVIRGKVEAIQKSVRAKFGGKKGKNFVFLDLGEKFLAPDGTLPRSLFFDGTHPTDAGYEIWAQALEPHLKTMVDKRP